MLSYFYEIELQFYLIIDSLKTDESGGTATHRSEWNVFGDEW